VSRVSGRSASIFSPLGKLASRAIYFACVNSFFLFIMIARRRIILISTGPIFTNFSTHDRYLFVDDRSGPLFPIPQGTLPWQPILGKIGKMTFIQQANIPKRIGIWQFHFKNIQWQYCSYIVCKCDQDWSSNPKDNEGNNCTFLDEITKLAYRYPIECLRKYHTDFHQTFSFGRHMYGDY